MPKQGIPFPTSTPGACDSLLFHPSGVGVVSGGCFSIAVPPLWGGTPKQVKVQFPKPPACFGAIKHLAEVP